MTSDKWHVTGDMCHVTGDTWHWTCGGRLTFSQTAQTALTACPIWNTSPFLGLHARARDALHQSMDEGRSAPVHPRKKKLHGKGHQQTTNTQTDIATTRPNRPSGPIRWKCVYYRITMWGYLKWKGWKPVKEQPTHQSCQTVRLPGGQDCRRDCGGRNTACGCQSCSKGGVRHIESGISDLLWYVRNSYRRSSQSREGSKTAIFWKMYIIPEF